MIEGKITHIDRFVPWTFDANGNIIRCPANIVKDYPQKHVLLTYEEYENRCGRIIPAEYKAMLLSEARSLKKEYYRGRCQPVIIQSGVRYEVYDWLVMQEKQEM